MTDQPPIAASMSDLAIVLHERPDEDRLREMSLDAALAVLAAELRRQEAMAEGMAVA